VESYSAAFNAEFTSNVLPTSASVAWGDGTTDSLQAAMMDYDSTTGRGRLYGIHDYSSPGDWAVTFTVQHDAESASETFIAPIDGGTASAGGTSAASSDFGGSDAMMSDAATSAADQPATTTIAAVSTGSAVNALDLGTVKAKLNRTATNPGIGPTGYSVFADLNADGQINALDLGVVKSHLNTRLPDGQPAAAAALPDAVGPFAALARVTQVFVNGAGLTSQSTANGIAFRTLAGIDTTYGYPLPAGTAQTRPISWSGGVNKIAIRFDNNVASQLGQSDLVVHGINTANYAVTGFTYDASTNTGVWTLGTAITRDKLMLILDDANVGGLDGEWTNGQSFPSGNGYNGGDFKYLFNVLVGDADQGAAPPTIDSVEWRPINLGSDNQTLPANTGNGTPGMDIGVQMFPDKLPTREPDTEDRSRVRVNVTLGQQTPNVRVYFRAFDIDDPSANTAPVDDETNENDNRGTGGFESTSGETASALTDDFGVASVVYKVPMQPGDNVRVVAGLDAAKLQLMKNVDANGDGVGVYTYSGNTRGERASESQMTEPLTVKRYLHIEREIMAGPSANTTEAFATEDDVKPTGNIAEPSLSVMTANYRAAYVEVKDDLGGPEGLNLRSLMPWAHNLTYAQAAAAADAINDVASQNDFWAVQLVAGYEGATDRDNDDNDEALKEFGLTPTGSFVWMETIRDRVADLNTRVGMGLALDTAVARVAFHETIHQFGYIHFDPKNPVEIGTVMEPQTNIEGKDDENRLTAYLIDLVRKAQKPQRHANN
jgi:hypothetical protein